DQRPELHAGRIEIAAVLEDVGHRSAEYAETRFCAFGLSIPLERLSPMGGTEEPALSFDAPDGATEPVGQRLGVAVGAGWRHLRAAPPGVERVMCPFDV